MTIALILAAMTILDWMTVYTAAKVYLVSVGIAYFLNIIVVWNHERP